jgi:hypothetical protein
VKFLHSPRISYSIARWVLRKRCVIDIDDFRNWHPLVELSLSSIPDYGMFPAVYALRDRRTSEILKFGSTYYFRNRIFGSYLGGIHEDKSAVLLYDTKIIPFVDIAWIRVGDPDEARRPESGYRRVYCDTHGYDPLWDRRGLTVDRLKRWFVEHGDGSA